MNRYLSNKKTPFIVDVPLGGFIIAVLTIVPNVLKLEYYA